MVLVPVDEPAVWREEASCWARCETEEGVVVYTGPDARDAFELAAWWTKRMGTTARVTVLAEGTAASWTVKQRDLT